MKENILRKKLESGQPTLSTHIHSVWPTEIEAIGHTGLYDYVEFVAEYGPSDLHDLDNLCRTSELFNLGSMIKIDQSLMPFLAQRGIGSGFWNDKSFFCKTLPKSRFLEILHTKW